jgi:PAS domain S-box-containing protein
VRTARGMLVGWLSAVILCAPILAADSAGPRRILLLHQFGVGEPIRTGFDAAFVAALRSSDTSSLELYEETIEPSRMQGSQESRQLREYFMNKYGELSIDVIVTQGMGPLTFARENRHLLGDAPIVGVASPAGAIEGRSDDVTGLQGGFYIGGTIDLARSLRPETTSVVVVDGTRGNDGSLQAEVERQMARRAPLDLVYLKDLPLSEVVSCVSALPQRAIVLFLRQTIRTLSQDVDQFDALDAVLRASPVPVFSQLEDFIGRGIVGGYVWRVQTDARRLAEMAVRIADGTSVREVPASRGTYATLLDWRQLQRWDIPASRVPAESVVLYRPPSFLPLNRNYVLGAMVVFWAQLALIGGLLVQRRRRRRAESELRNSEERYRSVIDTQSEMICRFLPDSTLTFVNDAYCHFWHKTRDDLLGTKFIDLIPPEARAQVLERIANLRSGPVSHEHPVLLPDGTTGWQHWTNQAIVDRHGSFVELQGVGRDITERKLAEATATALTTRNSALLRAIPDLMFVLTRDGTYVDYHVPDRTQLFKQPDEFLGRTIGEVMPAHLADLFKGAIEQAYRSREPIVIDYDLDIGERRHYEARLVVAEDSRLLTFVRVVTESRRVIELNRELAGRLIDSQERERQRIARELHDDISQKIALLNMEIDQIEGAMPPGEQRLRMRKLSVHAGDLATDVHQLSYELHPSKLQTLGLIASLESLCRDTEGQGRVRIAFSHNNVPSTIDDQVALCLYRIAQEALHNIAKHSRASDAQVQLAQELGDLRLQVTDSGVGFDLAKVGRSGLGLVSMQERVNPMRGHVAIHTYPGGGTYINVRVPLSPAAPGSAQPALS